ncbi:hypothetical protein BH23PAT1_BH23PAT1_3910 [soil metagenome]
MKRQTIAVDIDDVLAAHAEAFIDFSNKKYGTSLTLEDYHDHWSYVWKVEYSEIERRAKEFHVPKSVMQYKLIQEADKAIHRLSGNYDLVIVSARGQDLLQTTREWIDNYFAGLFVDTHFVPIWEPNNTVTKADICKQIGAAYLIDDVPGHCNIAAEEGITALLFGDYAWNRHEKIADKVVRVKNWQEVVEYFYGKS